MALVFLDIDGTLLPFGATITDPAGSDSLVPRIDPRHGPRLARLPGELVWATTWMEQANDVLAPVLGLAPLPVLEPLEPTVEDDYFGLHWKTRAIVDLAAGRAFAWVDDEITEADREWVRDRHAAPALLLRVDAHLGLTVQDLDALEAWLRTPPGPADRHNR
ncbi:HAD domain-containing protein [Pseudonocardia lacus]|uniref:HAD domain-containing protein n=1 Tax=Pseudonocardia lacus TaxID=2835865 RepID=UPI001BDCCBCF|nr:HAD domain-containing protein [Pseudonocardia lacus]